MQKKKKKKDIGSKVNLMAIIHVCLLSKVYNYVMRILTLGKLARKNSEDDILKVFHISSKLYPMKIICMKYQILFPGKNKKHVTSLSSAEFALRLVKVNSQEVLNKYIKAVIIISLIGRILKSLALPKYVHLFMSFLSPPRIQRFFM